MTAIVGEMITEFGGGKRLDRAAAIAILRAAGIAADGLRARHIPSGNDVFRLDTDGETFFLKAPAKDLEPWSDPLEGAGVKVNREQAAAECLKSHGLPGLDVMVAEVGQDNAIHRPYLLTRRVPGQPFTRIVPRHAQQRWKGPLQAVGAFLAAVHRIEFKAAGYVVTPEGPAGPTPPAPLMALHSAEVAQSEAFGDLDLARSLLDPALIETLEARFGAIAATIAPEYQPPRLVIGGFHPNHPFLDRAPGGWSVSGCIDLEVTSGGRTLDDLVTFAVGMMFRFDADIAWWEPLFEGYGSEPSLDRFRTDLLAKCSYLFGPAPALGATYQALLTATSWASLFNAHRPQALDKS